MAREREREREREKETLGISALTIAINRYWLTIFIHSPSFFSPPVKYLLPRWTCTSRYSILIGNFRFIEGREILIAMVLGSVFAILRHPEDFIPLMRLKMTAARSGGEIPPGDHWTFSYRMLTKVSRSFSLVVRELPSELRNSVRSLIFSSFFLLFFADFGCLGTYEYHNWIIYLWIKLIYA